MKARLRSHRKLTLIHEVTLEVAIAELKVFEVAKSEYYPDGLKYSMFLVLKESGRVVLGFDNHKPKGPHSHIHGRELAYRFRSIEFLVRDFWRMVRKEGFIL